MIISAEWSVVELTVFAKNNLTSLYQTNRRECYMRRDASTERMWPQQIQEWLRQVRTMALDKCGVLGNGAIGSIITTWAQLFKASLA